MARITNAGIEPTSTDAYMLQFADDVHSIGSDVSLEPSTPQAQLVRQWALSASATDASIIDIFNAVSLDTASGVHLDNLVRLLGFVRVQARRSTATVTFTGTAGTVVPAGTRLRSTSGDFFVTATGLTLTGTTGDVPVSATETGAISVDANTITSLVSAIAGISGVANAASGALGRATETDAELRNRYLLTLAMNALGPIVAVQSKVLSADGVSYCVVRDNPTASATTLQGVAIPAHALVAVVEGGSDAAVATAISASKPAGIPTSGSVSASVNRITGDTETIRFERVTAVPITVAVDYTPQVGVQGDLTQRITQLLVDYVSALDPGVALDTARAQAHILALPRYTLNSIAFRVRSGNTQLPTTVNLNRRLTLAASDVSVTQS